MAREVVREEKTDWVTAAALGLGAVGVGIGLWLYLRKPPGVSPGDVIEAKFSFAYLSDGGNYILVVRFGYYKPLYMPFGFDEEEKMGRHTLSVILPGPGQYEFNVECIIPDGAPPRTYDAEGSILTPQMVIGSDWLYRVFDKGVVTVREES